jgi:adenine-specific DNA-methyltransferase
MAIDCDQALMIWDGKSKGTADNLQRIKDMGKPFAVIRG